MPVRASPNKVTALSTKYVIKIPLRGPPYFPVYIDVQEGLVDTPKIDS